MFTAAFVLRCAGRPGRKISGSVGKATKASQQSTAILSPMGSSATTHGVASTPPAPGDLTSAADVVASTIVSMGSMTPFLRSLPPDTYVLYDPETQWRHWSVVVDGACSSTPPLTQATILLRSFLQQSDRGAGGKGAAAVNENDGCALVSLPQARKVSDSHRYVARLRKIAHDNAFGDVLSSKQFKVVVLPEFNPWVGNTFGLLQQLNPHLRIATGPTMAAFLSDSTFFKGVRDVLRRNGFARGFELDEMPFADISADAIDVVGSKTTAAGGRVDVVAGGHRTLSFLTGEDAEASSGALSAKQLSPAHFQYKPLLVYDQATRSVIAGPSTVGVRLPWLPHVEATLNADALLPLPTPFHITSTVGSNAAPEGSTQRGGGSEQSRRDALSASPAASPLLSQWQPEASLGLTLRALGQLPHVQRVVSTAYGELSHDRQDVVAHLTASTEALVGLRKRLAAKHFENGVVNAHNAAKCSDTLWRPMVHKVFEEVLFSRKSTGNLLAAGEADASPLPGGTNKQTSAVRAAAREVVAAHLVEPLSKALAYSAMMLAPTEGATFSAARGRANGGATNHQGSPAPAAGQVSADRAQSASSVATLKQLFAQRGFETLCGTLDKEEIDVDVFLSMRQEELTKTFKVTFGLTKKLQMLQSEVKAQMAKNVV